MWIEIIAITVDPIPSCEHYTLSSSLSCIKEIPISGCILLPTRLHNTAVSIKIIPSAWSLCPPDGLCTVIIYIIPSALLFLPRTRKSRCNLCCSHQYAKCTDSYIKNKLSFHKSPITFWLVASNFFT